MREAPSQTEKDMPARCVTRNCKAEAGGSPGSASEWDVLECFTGDSLGRR